MDLVDEIIKFSSVLSTQEDDPLRDGLLFRRFNGIETNSDIDNSESNTTVGFMEGGAGDEALPQKALTDETDPGTPASQATTSRGIEGWPNQREELVMEMQRLSMWKFDVLDQKIDQSFDGNIPLHAIVKSTILHIAQTMLRLVRIDLTLEENRSTLSNAWNALRTKTEQHRSSVRLWQPHEDSRPLTDFRSRQSSMSPNTEEEEVLSSLIEGIQRLKDMLNGLIVVDSKNTGKRLRRQDSMDDGVDQWKRTRLDSHTRNPCEADPCDLHQSFSDLSTIWGMDYFSRNLRKLGDDSINLTLEHRSGPSTAQTESTTHIGLGKGNNIEPAFWKAIKALGQSMSMNFKNARKGDQGSLPEYSTTHSMLQLLSCIDSWQVYTCKHSSPFVGPTVAAICISSTSQMLGTLMTWVQAFQGPSSLHAEMPSYDELTRLHLGLRQWMESSRAVQLESLLNENSARGDLLSKARCAVSSAIEYIRKVHVWVSDDSGENVHKTSHISDRTRLATRKHLSSEHSQASHLSISLRCAKKKEHLFLCDLSNMLKTGVVDMPDTSRAGC